MNNTATMTSSKRDILFIILLGLFAFTVGIHNQEFVQFNARFGLFAKNMYLHGITFFPTTYGKPYPDYPGLPIILIDLSFKLLNGVNLLTAILPTAITSTLTLVFIYKIASLQSRRWGWFAILFALFTYQFINEARAISLDQYIVFTSTLTFWLIYSADYNSEEKRLSWLPLVFAFGFFCRGPIGLIMPAGIMCFYYLCNKNWQALLKQGSIATMNLLICLAILLPFAERQGGRAFMLSVLEMQIFNRVAGSTQHNFLFYWTRSIGNYMLTMPIAFAMMILLAKQLIKPKNPQLKLLQQCTIWILLIMLAMSIPSQNKIRYILPIVPAMSLMASYLFSEFKLNNALTMLRKIVLLLIQYLPIFAIIAAIYLIHFNKHHSQLPLMDHMITLIILSTCIFSGTLYLKYQLKNIYQRHMIIITGGILSLFATQILIVEPVVYLINQTRPFTQKIESISKAQHRQIVFYQVEPDGLAIKYLVNTNMNFKPIFIYTHRELLHYPHKAIFVSGNRAFYQTSRKILSKIHIVVKGQIGHNEAVGFVTRS